MNPVALLCAVGMLAASAVATGCGGEDDGGLPDGAVAMVGDVVITRADFEGRVKEEAAGEDQGETVSHVPPDYAACVAAKQKRPAGREGASDPSEADLQEECSKEYGELRAEAMRSLIRSEWIRQEVEKRDIELDEAAVRRAAERERRQGFSGERGYRAYLRAAGMTERDFVSRVRVDELAAKVTADLNKDVEEPSGEDIADYYRRSKEEFLVPERRWVRLLAAKSRAKAEEARAALDRGRSWKSVAAEYSDVPLIAGLRGRALPFGKGQQEPAIEQAIFGGPIGRIVGPVKSEEQDDWRVFEVEYSRPPHQRSLPQVREEILEALREKAQQKPLIDFLNRYRAKTTCASGYRIPDCNNGPKESQAS